MPDSRDVLNRPAPAPDAVVRYGDHPDQVADVRLPPAGAHEGPLVVVIHGGFWRAEWDRAHTAPLAAALAAAGHPVAQLEYRRTGAPGGGWPGTFDDVAAGVPALPGLVADVAAARGARIDAGPPILLGHSAGGHLALWLASRSAPAGRGVVALAPVADLAEAHRLDLDGGAVHALLGGGPAERPERYAAADPLARTPPRLPTVIIHGVLDRHVPIGISRRYAAAVAAAGGDVHLVELPEVEHFALIDPLAPTWPAVTTALRSLH
jgi:acetyl esterase/lipase